MSKKVLSFLLIAAILLTSTLFSGLVVTAETKTWAVGDQPYAVEGKSNKIEVYNASSATFYDDFVMPSYWTFEDANVVDADTLRSKKSIQLNNANANVIKTGSGTEYLWLDLSSDTDGVNENAYGGTGKAIKVTTASTVGVKNAYTGGFYNSIRRNAISFDCTTFPSFDDIAISFWVKTEGESHFSAAFWDTNTNSGKKLCTDDIYVPEAGEYIIVLPISSFRVSGTGYVKNEDISTFKMQNFEIMFKTAVLAAGETADFYFDNIGIYAIKPNFGKATHSKAAYIKENFESYVVSETEAKTVIDNKTGFKWLTQNGGTTTFSLTEHDGGNAICYQTGSCLSATRATALTASNAHTFTANNSSYIIYLNMDDSNLNTLGSNATLAFWIKSSRAMRIMVNTNNSNGAGNGWVSSNVYNIPAGESIVRIPVESLLDDDPGFTKFKKFTFYFVSETATANTISKAATVIVDDIAIEPTFVEGDTNGDKVTDICDIVKAYADLSAAPADIKAYDVYKDSVFDVNDIRMFRYNSIGRISTLPLTAVNLPDGAEESFTPATLRDATDKLWKKNENTTLTSPKNALFYRSGDNDTSAYVVDYANLKTTTGGKFYYDNSIPVPYGSDSVFGFWVYSEQSLHLKCGYIDKYFDQTQGKDVNQQFYYELDIPAGESFVTIDMEQIATSKVSHTMNYSVVYQFQINIWTNNNTENTEGTLYIDSFGFYDKDTTNDIGYTPAE